MSIYINDFQSKYMDAMKQMPHFYHLHPCSLQVLIPSPSSSFLSCFRWSRSRGHPDSARHGLTTSREASFAISTDDDDLSVATTPYRLPRISPRGDESPQPEIERALQIDSPEADKVWSRYGYEKIIRCFISLQKSCLSSIRFREDHF